jgi:hypothetical protein
MSRNQPNHDTEQLEPLRDKSTVTKTKVLTVTVNGNINTFSKMGQEAALWRPCKGTHATIFGMEQKHNDRHMDVSKALDLDGLNAAISNVTVKHVSIQQCHNTFKIPLGVSINCIPG